MNPVQTGTFEYHDRKGSRVLSWLLLPASLLIALLAGVLTNDSLIATILFMVAFIVLAIATRPLERRLYVHKAGYELTSQKLTLHLAKEDLVLYRKEVNGVGCDPVLTKSSQNQGTANYWKITIQTVPRADQKKKKYEFYSLNIKESDEENQNSLREFQAFGRELKRWFGMIV